MDGNYIDNLLEDISETPELDLILDCIEAPVTFSDESYIVENTETLKKTIGLLESLTGEDGVDLIETAVLVGLKMRIAIELHGGFKEQPAS